MTTKITPTAKAVLEVMNERHASQPRRTLSLLEIGEALTGKRYMGDANYGGKSAMGYLREDLDVPALSRLLGTLVLNDQVAALDADAIQAEGLSMWRVNPRGLRYVTMTHLATHRAEREAQALLDLKQRLRAEARQAILIDPDVQRQVRNEYYRLCAEQGIEP